MYDVKYFVTKICKHIKEKTVNIPPQAPLQKMQKILWQQRDLNPQTHSSLMNTQPFSQNLAIF